MMGRFLFWPSRLALILFGIVAFALAVYASAAQAQQICAVDLNGNGDADDAGETASCVGMQGGSWQCPIGGLTAFGAAIRRFERSEEHTSELQSLMRISYAVFC